jgi:NTE family protein
MVVWVAKRRKPNRMHDQISLDPGTVISPTTTMAPRKQALALVLQGGGALGAYQAGAYEELAKSGNEPDWLAGISIGAINAALIAGNKPEHRVEALRNFWQGITKSLTGQPFSNASTVRSLFNEASAWFALTSGIDGFFTPRMFPPAMQMPGTLEALSYYDTTPLRRNLEEHVDFNLLNTSGPRLSVGAVHIQSGNFVYFDNRMQKIGPQHILASAALPPGFPPVIIDGEAYWDGGLVSNTPLQHVLDNHHGVDDIDIIQVDLFSATGAMPKNIFEVAEREKEIRFSSRTRLNTTAAEEKLKLHNAALRLAKRLPQEFADDPDLRQLTTFNREGGVSIFLLIHRTSVYDSQSMDYEFSRLSMTEHWTAGQADMLKTLEHDTWITRSRPHDGIVVHDLAKDVAPEK